MSEHRSEHETSISPIQLLFLIVQTQIGVGVLSLPNNVFLKANKDGWISVIIAGVIIQVIILVLVGLCSRFPDRTFYEFLPLLFGGFIGKIFSVLYILYFIMVSIIILTLFGNIVSIWAFPRTPDWIIYFLLCVICIYLVKENLRTIARYYILSSFSLIVLIFLFINVYSHVNILYILPIGSAGMNDILKGAREVTVSLLGVDVLLVIFSFTKGKTKGKLVSVTLANFFVTLFYTFITFTTMIFFSAEEFPLVPEPVLYILKALEFKVIERIDLIFLSLWLLSVATSLMSYFYLAATGLAKLLKRKSHSGLVNIVGILALIGSVSFENIYTINKFAGYVSKAGLIMVGILPIFFLTVALIKKKLGEKNA